MIRSAVVVFSHAGQPAAVACDWAFERLAGLRHVERLLASLSRAGLDEVRLVADPAVAGLLSRWLDTADSSGPRRVSVHDGLDASIARDVESLLVVDGRRIYHQPWLERVVSRGVFGDYVDEHGRPAGLRVVTPGNVAAAKLIDFDAPMRDVQRLSVPEGAWAASVDTADGRRRARGLLAASLTKSTDGWFSRHLNRPVSTRISLRLAPLGVHPDVVTAVTFGVAIASAVFSARGTWAGFVWGGVLFQLASILDGVDGELARLRFKASAHGQWLDTVCDDLSNVMYLGGVTLGVARSGYPAWIVQAGIAAVALDVITVAIMYWQLLARREEGTLLAFQGVLDWPAFGRGLTATLARRLHPFMKRDMYAWVFMLTALAGLPWVPLVATPVALVFTLAGFVRILSVLARSEA